MQADGQIVRFAFQSLIQHPGIRFCQLVGIVAAIAHLLALFIGTQIGPDGIIELQIAAAGIIEGADGIAPGRRQIVEIVGEIRINRGIDIFTPAAEMEHARAWNGHLRLCFAADAFQIAKIFQHRMIAKRQFANDANAVCPGLHAVKLDPIVGIVAFNAF